MSTSRVASLGEYLREQRSTAQMSSRQLAEQAGVSNPYLSQVERGKSGVTLESLRKIADALNVAPSAFFSGSTEQDDWAGRLELFHYKDLSEGIQEADFSPILVTLQPGENKGSAFSHNGYEFLFVTEGVLTVEVDGEQFELPPQQSTMFDARKKHYWFNLTDQPVRFLVVSSKMK